MYKCKEHLTYLQAVCQCNCCLVQLIDVWSSVCFKNKSYAHVTKTLKFEGAFL